LHDHGGSDDGGDTELHESTSVGSEDGSHPVEGIRLFTLDDTVEGNLAAEQVDKHNDTSPDLLGLKRDLPDRSLDLGDDCDCGSEDREEFSSFF